MKILFISEMAGNPWGGSEELWVKSAEYAISKGHEIIFSVYDWGELHPKLENLISLNATVSLRTRGNYKWAIAKASFGKLMHKILSPRQVRGLKKYSPDVIIISQGTVYEAVFPAYLDLIKSTNAKAYYITQANTEYNMVPSICYRVGRDLFPLVEKMYFVSERNLKVAERQFALKFNNAEVVSNPANLENYTIVPWPDGQTLNLACVGRLNSTVKGLGVLLEILSGSQWKSRNWKLNFYGKGPDEKYLLDLVVLYGLESKVIFHGFVRGIDHIWKVNHVIMMPSTLEGTPLSLIEAMLCGRPAVVSDVGGNAELIEEGNCGFVADAPSVNSFGRAMERMWASKDNLEKLGLKANEVLRKKVDLDSYKKIIDRL